MRLRPDKYIPNPQSYFCFLKIINSTSVNYIFVITAVQRMEEGRLPKEVMKWRPPGRRKRGRPKLTWAEGIRGLMGEKGLMEEDWRKKII